MRIKVTWLLVAAVTVWAAGRPSGAGAGAQSPRTPSLEPDASCAALSTLPMTGTVITEARRVPAGTLVVPGRGGAAARPLADLAAFCRVRARVETSSQSTIQIEVWLPEQGWNGNFLANGFSFYGGTLDPSVLADALRQGYATATTDGGGGGTERGAAFLHDEPEKLRDYSGRAWHETTVRAKALIDAYYGRPPAQSHWEACGGGARGGLQSAARYPGDYDAIAVGAANYTSRLVFAQMAAWQAGQGSPGSGIPASKLPVLHNAALAACDARDGVADGVIQDPASCRFDPAVLTCRDADGSDCLTAAQVATARAIYAGVLDERTGRRLTGGLFPGSELGWTGSTAQPSSMAVDFFRHIVFKDRAWDPQTRRINFDADVALTERPEIKALDISPTLADFVARGGKLVLYAGWADIPTSPQFSIDYYNDIVATLGASAREGVRLFMVPGMGHCPGTTGSSAYDFDALALVANWRSTGAPPEQFVATRYAGGMRTGTSLVCAYPRVPQYSGAGTVTDARSFVCQSPPAGSVVQQDAGTALIAGALTAMGGADRIARVRRLVIEGGGDDANLGQQMSPGAPLLNWKVQGYRKVIDLAQERMRVTMRRRSAFPARGATESQRPVNAVDGDHAFNVSQAGVASRQPARVAAERRVERLHHPLTALRAAADPASTLRNVREEDGRRVVDVVTARGDQVTLAVDLGTNLPVFVRSMGDHQNLGDVATVTWFSHWEDVNGVKLPKRLRSTIDRFPEMDIHVAYNTLDADEEDLAVPKGLLDGPQQAERPSALAPQPIAPGIWYMTGGINSVLVEFSDHLALVEVPGGEARVFAMLDAARALRPDKPVTEAIVTHFHYDHTAGLRAAVSRGLRIITQRGNETAIREMVTRPHTINPDALAARPRPLDLVTFEDGHTLRDAAMELQLYHVPGNPHGDTQLMVYFPRERILAQADMYSPPTPNAPLSEFARNLADEIARRGLSIDRHLPLHAAGIPTHREFLALIDSLNTLDYQMRALPQRLRIAAEP